MNSRWFRPCILTPLCLLAACTTLGTVQPGKSTQAEVRRQMGMPSDIRFQPDGDEVWEYAKGPYGRQTYVVTFRKDGVVQAAQQVLTDQTMAQIRPGVSSKPQVRALLGKPTDVEFLSSGEVWDYNIEETPNQPYILVVRFNKDGSVRDVGKVRESTSRGLFQPAATGN
jgi:hypothetical protein